MSARLMFVTVLLLVPALVVGCETAGPTPTPVSETPTIPASPTAAPPSPTATPETTAPSGSGGVLAFYSERDGNPEIYTIKPDGSDLRRLTFNQFEDSSPAWSPDGSQIAFVSDRDDPQAGTCFPKCLYQLYLIDADGAEPGSGNERKLVDTDFAALHPDWHPDGTRLSFDSEFNLQGDVYVVNADGSGLHLLIEDGFWADWSPDGTQIVFASNRAGTVELYVADADGSNQRRLTENRTTEIFPAWSPDGRRIAFTVFEQRHIFVMNADGSDVRQLTDRGRSENPAWSPDGTYLAFQSSSEGDFEIYIIYVEDALQGKARSLRLTNNNVGDFWPAWGPAAPQSSGSIRLEKSAQAFPSAPTYQIGLGDLDGDGDLDAVFANSQLNPCQVWLNDGTGQFADTGQRLTLQGHGVSLGDLDGDGDLDALITCHEEERPSRVYLNDGHAVFQDSGQRFGDAQISGNGTNLADVDADGDLDAVIKYYQEGNRVYLNDGRAHFTRSDLAFPAISVWGDLDGDGDVDVFFKEEGVGLKALLNDGAGAFSPHWAYADTTITEFGDIALGDTDGDGDLDAVVPNGDYRATADPTRIFLNDGSGRFADSGQQLGAVRNANVALGDLDGDGDLDLVLTDYQEPNQVWLNDGAGRYVDSGFRFGSGRFYRHAHLGDLDGDGDLDVFLAVFGLGSCPNEVWFNR